MITSMNEPITTLLLILLTTGTAAWIFEHPEVQEQLMFNPEAILARKQYYRLLTSCFPHCGGWPHLLVNMYSLYLLGGQLEWLIGPTQLLVVYLGSVVGGNLLCLYLHRFHEYAAAGASGGVCGLLLAYVLLRPTALLVLFPVPQPVPAWLYGIGFVAASFYAMKVHQPEVAHDAHLGGAISGVMILAVVHPEAVRRHWLIFAALLVTTGLILFYVYYNPMFLPLSSFSSAPRRHQHQPPNRAKSNARPATASSSRPSVTAPATHERDWLLERIEEQVGKLVPDPTGLHDWVDKYGRTYHVVRTNADRFNFEHFSSAVMDHLNTPAVRFLILDTRQLDDAQMALVRPFIGNLPEAQFNRIIRSYGFNRS